MAFIEIDQIKIGGSTKPFGGYIYDMSYDIGFNGTPSSLSITLVNESGSYDFTKANLSVKNTTTIVFGKKELQMYPVSFDNKNSSSGKFIRIKYLDGSVILDQYAVTQKYKHPNGGSCFNLGSAYKSISGSSYKEITKKYTLKTNVKKLDKFDPNAKILYTPNEFLDILKTKVNIKNSGVLNITNYYVDYIGTFNDVLRQLSEDLSFSYYWSEDNKLVFVDARSPISINKSKINSITKKQEITSSFSIEDTYVNAVNGYYQFGRNVVTASTRNNGGSSYQSLDTESLQLERAFSGDLKKIAEIARNQYQIPESLIGNAREGGLFSFLKASLAGGIQMAMAYVWFKLLQSKGEETDLFKAIYGASDNDQIFFKGEGSEKIKEIGNYLRKNNIMPETHRVAAVSNVVINDLKVFSSDFNDFLDFLSVAGRYYVRTVNSQYLNAYNWDQPFKTIPVNEPTKNTELKRLGQQNETIEQTIARAGIQRLRRTGGDGEFGVEPLSCILLDSVNHWVASSNENKEDINKVKKFYNSLQSRNWDIANLNLNFSIPVTIFSFELPNYLNFSSFSGVESKSFIEMKGSRFVTNNYSDNEEQIWGRIGETNDARAKNARKIKLNFKELTAEQVEINGGSLEELYENLIKRQAIENKNPDEKINFSLSEIPANDLLISDGLESMSVSVSSSGMDINYSFGTSLQKLPSDSYIQQTYFNIHPTQSWKDIKFRSGSSNNIKIRV